MTESSKAETSKGEATTPAKTDKPPAVDVVPAGTPMASEPVEGEPTGIHVPGQPPGGTAGDGPVVLHYDDGSSKRR